MTAIIYVDRTKYADDGCDWTHVIVWHMKAGARARNRSVFVATTRYRRRLLKNWLEQICLRQFLSKKSQPVVITCQKTMIKPPSQAVC
jgi:hypothetical protein